MPGNAFAILHTPVLLWLRAMVLYGGKSKPSPPPDPDLYSSSDLCGLGDFCGYLKMIAEKA